jgi:hypothetical protein
MAIAGDIIIKLIADFAEFASGMTQSAKALEEFGKKAEQQNITLKGIAKTLTDLAGSSSVDAFSGKLDKIGATLGKLGIIGAAAAAAIGLVTAAIAKVQAVEAYALAVDDLKTKFQLTSEQAQVLQLASERTGVSAEDLRKRIASIPGEWDKLIAAAKTQNLLRDNLDDAAKASKGLKAAWDDFMLSLTPSGTIISAVTATLRALTAVVHGLSVALDEVTKVRTIDANSVPAGLRGMSQNPYATAPQYDPYGLQAYRRIAFAQQNGLPNIGAPPGFAAGGLVGSPIVFPHVPTFGEEAGKLKDTPTPTTPTGGGGGTSAEDLAALVKRYQEMTEAAKAATAEVRKNLGADADDLAIILQAKIEAQTIIAKILQTRNLDEKQQAALIEAVTTAKLANAERERATQYSIQAAATEQKFGDTTVATSKAVRDLVRQFDSGRLSATGFNRALKETSEQTQLAALAAKRYDDDIASLQAGFESAAISYARANDLFSVGQQAFGGLTTAMGEGLDALAGKSSKTFEQIAGDFALMLSKLALQAAVSQIFKILFGAVDPVASLSTDQQIAVFSSYGGRRATGGSVFPGTSYTVGEHGPERFVPAAVGSIQPMSSTGSNGDVTVNVAMGGASRSPDPKSTLEFARRVKAAVLDTIQNEQRPGGILYARG